MRTCPFDHDADILAMMGNLPAKIGPYRVVRQLGEGGMGAVFEAIHEAIERRVAIKVLHPEYARNAEFIARFFNEARAVNRVAHPGLVQISDYGQQPDGTTYIVMEFLDGESLARRLERLGGKLSIPEATHFGWQLADSLSAAHARGIVHRDLKPQNVMIVPDPQTPGGERIKLLDFGIAKVTDPGASPRIKTKTDQVMGTPTYMSPEQCEGAGHVDAKSDVYSLGVMLFELLAGQPPFSAEGGGKVLGMHMFVAPPLLQELALDTPAPLADLVQSLLAKKKEERPTMRQLATALERLSEQHPLAKRSGNSWALATDDDGAPDAPRRAGGGPSTLGLSASQTLRQHPQLRRLGMMFSGAAIALGIVTTIRFSLGRRANESPLSPNVGAVQARRITLRVDTDPPAAELSRLTDGQEIGKAPWQFTQQASEGPLRLRVHLDGYEDQVLSLAGNVDDHVSVRLMPRPVAPTQPLDRANDKVRSKAAVGIGIPKAPPVRPITPTASDERVKPDRPRTTQPIYVKPPLEK